MPRVLANATVDVIYRPGPEEKGLTLFSVEVFGREPHDYVRTYRIRAKTDMIAVQEGISRFVAEMEAREEQ
jgi:hypothetical protein